MLLKFGPQTPCKHTEPREAISGYEGTKEEKSVVLVPKWLLLWEKAQHLAAALVFDKNSDFKEYIKVE